MVNVKGGLGAVPDSKKPAQHKVTPPWIHPHLDPLSALKGHPEGPRLF